MGTLKSLRSKQGSERENCRLSQNMKRNKYRNCSLWLVRIICACIFFAYEWYPLSVNLLKNSSQSTETPQLNAYLREHNTSSFSNQRSILLPSCASNSSFASPLYVWAVVFTVCYGPHEKDKAGMQYGVLHSNDDILISKWAYIWCHFIIHSIQVV